MPHSTRLKAIPGPAAAPHTDTTFHVAAERRAHALELYERAMQAHYRARSCLQRAHGLLRQAQVYVGDDPAPMPPSDARSAAP